MTKGYKTSEFWLTMANTVIMAVVAFGIVDQADAEKFSALLAPVIGAVVPLAAYVWSRTQVKS